MLIKSLLYRWLFLKLLDLYFQYFFYTLNNMITLCLDNTNIFLSVYLIIFFIQIIYTLYTSNIVYNLFIIILFINNF